MTTPNPVDALAAEAFGDKYNADPADPAMAHEWRIFSDGFQASARALAAVPAVDDALTQALKERDDTEDMADQLAAQIAAITGADIGEHTSANDPWCNAMLAADEWIAEDLRRMLDGRPEQPRPPTAQQAGGVPAGWHEAVQRLVFGFEHVSGIARQWEPDHSSGADRAKWARATEACADVAKLLYAPTPPAVPPASSPQEAASSLAKWLNEQPNRPINLEDVAMLVHHVQSVQPLSEAQINEAWTESAVCRGSLGSRREAFREGAKFAERSAGIVTPKEPTP